MLRSGLTAAVSAFHYVPYPLNNVHPVGVGKLQATMALVMLVTHSHTYAYSEVYSEAYLKDQVSVREGLQLRVDIYFR